MQGKLGRKHSLWHREWAWACSGLLGCASQASRLTPWDASSPSSPQQDRLQTSFKKENRHSYPDALRSRKYHPGRSEAQRVMCASTHAWGHLEWQEVGKTASRGGGKCGEADLAGGVFPSTDVKKPTGFHKSDTHTPWIGHGSGVRIRDDNKRQGRA